MNWKLIIGGIVLVAAAVLAWRFFRGSREGFKAGPVAENTFTMYYADWCPHCKSAKPEFKELVNKGYIGEGRSRCKVRMVSVEENPEAVKAAPKPINGFPTFLLETPGGEVYEYQGSRNTEGYLKFLNEKLGGGI
jgi:thiol-disulfide isomerase/thioredoxin